MATPKTPKTPRPWHGLTDVVPTQENTPEPWTVVSAPLPGSGTAYPSTEDLACIGARAVLADPRATNAWKMAAHAFLVSQEPSEG